MNFDNIRLCDIQEFISEFKHEVNFTKEYQFRIRRQGNFPACSAHAWINCIEYLRQIDGYKYENLSVLYHYYMTRVLSKCEGKIKGLSIESSLESLFENGAIHPTTKVINIDSINERPSGEDIAEAKLRIINKNLSCKVLEIDINVFKYVLSEMGVPFVAVIHTTKDKLQDREPKIFKYTLEDYPDSLHAICIVGYDDEEEVYIFQNSYGPDWHYGGFGKIHYSYISNITKSIALEKSCIKNDENLISSFKCEDYQYILDELTYTTLP